MEEQSARASKSKDRHPQRNVNANPTKRSQNMLKYDVNQLLPPSAMAKTDSSVNQVLNETNKIVKLGVQREFVLLEKEKAIKEANETIDNLRKNIIEVQMEYEKLDQNYQREISYRSELIKRTDTTRGMVESAVHYSNILATSIKQLEDDKLKIAEFYSIIHKGQLEVEEKFKKTETLLKEQDDLIQKCILCVNETHEKEILQAKDTITQLNKKAAQLNNKLKSEMEQSQKVALEIAELKTSNEVLKKSLNEAKIQSKKKCYDMAVHLKLKAAFKNLREKKAKDEKDMKRKHKLEKKAFREKIKEIQKSHEEIISENNQLKSEIDNVRSAAEKFMKEVNEFQSQIEEKDKLIQENKIEKEKFQEEIQGLSEKIENMKIEAEKGCAALEDNYRKILAEKENLESVINNLNIEKVSEIEKFSRKLEELEKELNAVNEKKTELENQIFVNDDIANKERLNTLEAIKTYEGKIEFLEVQVNNLKERESTWQNLINEKCQELDKITNELNMRDSTLKELSGKMVDLDETKNSVGELSSELNKLKANNIALTAELEKLRKENDFIKDKLDSEKNYSKTLKSDKNKLEKTSKNLQEELQKEIQLFERMKSDYDGVKNELHQARKTNEDVMRKDEIIAQLKKSLEESKADVEARRVIVKKLETDKEREISDLKRELKSLRDTKEKDEEFLKNEIEAVRKNLMSQLDGKEAEIRQLQEEKEKLTMKMTASRTPVIEKGQEFSKPIIPERKTTAVTFAQTAPPTRRFLSTSRNLFGGSSNSKSNPRPEKDIYAFDSDSSYETIPLAQIDKVLQKKQPAAKKRKV